jgi:hypothetical protein
MKTATISSFCSFVEQKSQEATNMLGSLLAQMCEQDITLLGPVQQTSPGRDFLGKSKVEGPNIDDLIAILTQSSERYDTIYMFIDAANESKDPETLVNCLLDLANKTNKFRALLSSTEETVSNF